MIRFALCALAIMVMPVSAQQKTENGSGAVLRALDKINGETVDIEMSVGQVQRFGRLQISLKDCRYPAGNRTGNAFASLDVNEVGREGSVFEGWMIASAPALNAMDHARYDVWVMRCTTS
jgi:hypothetical protein